MISKRSTGVLAGILILVVVCAMMPQASWATAPQDVKLMYDATSQTLTVTITHPSVFPGYHYIKHVEILKNGSRVSDNVYENQPDPKTFTYSYKMAAATGDVLEVTARCSLYGSKTVKLTVGK